MKKLTKAQEQEWASAIEGMQDARDKVNDLRAAFVAAITAVVNEHLPKLAEAIDEWNGASEQANDVRGNIESEMDDYMGERADAWHEGASGQQFASWHSEWSGADLTPSTEGTALEIIFQEVQDGIEDVPELPMMDDAIDAAESLATEVE